MPPTVWRTLIMEAGPATGPLLLAATGLYGGRYAAEFKPPFDDYASWICIAFVVTGGIIATVQFTVSASGKKKKGRG
jgi:hypothetical protein